MLGVSSGQATVFFFFWITTVQASALFVSLTRYHAFAFEPTRLGGRVFVNIFLVFHAAGDSWSRVVRRDYLAFLAQSRREHGNKQGPRSSQLILGGRQQLLLWSVDGM